MYSKYRWLHSFLGPKIARVALRYIIGSVRNPASGPGPAGARAVVDRTMARRRLVGAVLTGLGGGRRHAHASTTGAEPAAAGRGSELPKISGTRHR